MTRPAGFWARRRAAARAEEATAPALQDDALPQADRTDAEILAELDLPDPDTLDRGDDFAAFMARAVPAHIRQRALRKLWRSNPVLACMDGLNDYDDDYLAGSHGNAPVRTSYQVGKGLLSHVLEMAHQEEQGAGDRTTLDTGDVSSQDDPGVDPEAAGQTAAPDIAAEDPEPPQEPDRSRPRRMAFHFDGSSA